MNICEHLLATAKIFPDRPALLFEDRAFTYEQLNSRSNTLAARLAAAGVTPGDRVAIALGNVPAFVVWYYATLRLGAVAATISTRLTAKEAASLIQDSGAVVLVGGSGTIQDLRDELAGQRLRFFSTTDTADEINGEDLDLDGPQIDVVERDPHDAALILYTSGTTGFAKGATLSHYNVRTNVHAFNHLCDMRTDDRILLVVPLFHCFGQNALLNSAFNVGATLVLQRHFELEETTRLISAHRITQLYGVPMMFQIFLDHCQAADLDPVRYCFSAAAPLPLEVSRRWQQKFGMPINEGYGLTETSPFASYNHRLHFVPGSIGTPIDGVEMRIVDPDSGDRCQPGELGEITIRGPNVMLGYWNRPADTAAVIRDGWFHSGDIGRRDSRGYFYIVDRVKDMIAVAGLKVFPAEVERVLRNSDDVAEVAVVGIPHPVLGEQVIAFVVLSGDPAKDTSAQLMRLRRHAQEQLAGYRMPADFQTIEELPRNASGKVLKTQLREIYAARTSTTKQPASTRAATGFDGHEHVSTSSVSPLLTPSLRAQLSAAYPAARRQLATEYLQHLVQSLTDCERLPGASERFVDIGMDSLSLVELTARLQAEVGPQPPLPATLAFDYPRVGELAEFLVQLLASPTTLPTGSAAPSAEASVEAMSEAEAEAALLRELED